MDYLEIEKVIGREIMDSRGNPTVEAEVYLVDGTIGRGAAPHRGRAWKCSSISGNERIQCKTLMFREVVTDCKVNSNRFTR